MKFTYTASKLYNSKCIYNNMENKARKMLIYSSSKIIDLLLFIMFVFTCAPTSNFEVSDAEGLRSCVASCCVLRMKVFHAECLTTHIAINGTLINFN